MPSLIQGFAEHQPVTPVIETLRSLLLGTPAGSSPWQAIAWCSGILVVSITLAATLFDRRTR
jgi:ABC-2 type transport system permease protein